MKAFKLDGHGGFLMIHDRCAHDFFLMKGTSHRVSNDYFQLVKY